MQSEVIPQGSQQLFTIGGAAPMTKQVATTSSAAPAQTPQNGSVSKLARVQGVSTQMSAATAMPMPMPSFGGSGSAQGANLFNGLTDSIQTPIQNFDKSQIV